jgi:hypothetical protein
VGIHLRIAVVITCKRNFAELFYTSTVAFSNYVFGIQGGQDHGVPILITEIKEGQLAEASGKFIVGDAILSVNGVDLRKIKHAEAVDILSRLVGLLFFFPLNISQFNFLYSKAMFFSNSSISSRTLTPKTLLLKTLGIFTKKILRFFNISQCRSIMLYCNAAESNLLKWHIYFILLRFCWPFFSFYGENCRTTDSLRALSARSESPGSGMSRLSQRRRPRFPGRAVDVTRLGNPSDADHNSSV